MKTKIIYISGSEVFDMQDIRTAFDQVRNALGLGTDTVLFGVPVDKADALGADVIPSVSVAVQSVATDDAPEIAPEITQPIIDTAPIVATDTPSVDAVAVAPVSEQVAPQKKSRGRPKSQKKAEKTPEPVTTTESNDIVPDATQNSEKVVSILSVLTAKQDTAPVSDTPAPADETVTEITPDINIIDDTPVVDEVIEPIDVDELPTMDGIDDIAPDDASQVVSIDDMITNDTPVAPQEKTLEQLLESMTPLREDVEHEQHIDATDSFDDATPDDTPDDIADVSADDDATLEQLATEFAENQDKIETVTKTENHGKIGKLKNILPFKKARRDDSGLMGDLFGWAGIAANDEDFAIPGFFTNAASKK